MTTVDAIILKDFKGLSIDTNLSHRTLLVGPNGSGKTAHTEALQLVLTGYIPGAGKQNSEILDTFGCSDSLWVGVKINGRTLGRQFKRSKSGSVSQFFYKGKAKIKKDEFNSLLVKEGAPVVVDIASFMALSDQKKIDYIFDLYPPEGDVSELDEKIESVKEKINGHARNIRDAERSIERLAADRKNLELPAGTLAEVKDSIEKTQAEVDRVSKEIGDLKLEMAKTEMRQEQEKQEANRKLDAEKRLEELYERKKDLDPDIEDDLTARAKLEAKIKEAGVLQDIEGYKKATEAESTRQFGLGPEGNAIEKIITVMDDAGCELCAARMVAKVELKKLRG